MSKEEIKELFIKYNVKNLNDKNGQSECLSCKSKHKYSLTWTCFIYEYEEHYYCYDCLLNILLQQENKQLKEQNNILFCQLKEMQMSKTDYTQVNILEMKLHQRDKVIEEAIKFMKSIEMDKTDKYIPIRDYKEYETLFNILTKYKGDNNE